MTNAYKTAQDLGFTGTPEEIVAQLVASGLTARPIQLDDLMAYLNIPLGMLRRLPRADSDGSKWSGSLFNLLLWVNENGTQQQKDGLNSFFSHITNDRNRTFDTTKPEFAAQFWQVAQMFGGTAPQFPSAEDFAAVAALGGGWLFADLTVQKYNADKVSYELQQAAQSALAALQTRRQKWDQVSAEWRSKIETGQVGDVVVISRADLAQIVDDVTNLAELILGDRGTGNETVDDFIPDSVKSLRSTLEAL